MAANKTTNLIEPIIYTLLGIFILIYPDIFYNYLKIILASLLLLLGVYLLIKYIKDRKNTYQIINLFFSIILILISLIVMFLPENSEFIISLLGGLFFVFQGIKYIPQYLEVKTNNINLKIIKIINVLLPCLMGVAIVFMPVFQIRIFGIALLVVTAFTLYAQYRLTKQ